MKKNSDKTNNDEKAERDSTEDEKCLENGETAEANKSSRLGQVAKSLAANRYFLVLLFLCVLLLLFFIIIIVLSVHIGYLSRSTTDKYCVTSECLSSASRIVASLNDSYEPCADFWSYSCGGWIQKHPLPGNRGSLTVLDDIHSDINWKLRHLLDLVPHDADVKDPEGKVKKFYSSCVNLNDLEYRYSSDQRIREMINEVDGWSVMNTWSPQNWDRNNVIQKLHLRFGVQPFFKITVEPDDISPTTNIIKIQPNGLGLPGRSYYFNTDNKKYEDSYKLYMDNVARQFGATASDANRFAENMFHYEKRLAEVMPTADQYQNPALLYKKLSIKELTSLAPTIQWLTLLQQKYPKSNLNELTEVAICTEQYFRQLSSIISTTDSSALHNYLIWQLISHYVPHLSSVYSKLANQFHQTLAGAKNPSAIAEDHWEFCLRVTSKYFGHALGSMYVKKYFKSETRMEVLKIVENILQSFVGSLHTVPWLEDSKSTEVVKEKAKMLLNLIGYPDFITNRDYLIEYYNGLEVQLAVYLRNLQNAEQFLIAKQDEMLKSPASPEHSWTISAQDVKAKYQYAGNHFVVAAGLLHPSLFEIETPAAVKYGSIGAMLGSVIFKAFDNKGIRYQQYGMLSPWLSGMSKKVYLEDSRCLLNNYTFPDSLDRVTNLTLGETIADIAGLKFAYKAFKDNAANGDKEMPGLQINSDKMFFISYAQSMCQNLRQEKIDACRDVSTSSPNKFRVSRALMQVGEFARTFECSSGSAMTRAKGCTMW